MELNKVQAYFPRNFWIRGLVGRFISDIDDKNSEHPEDDQGVVIDLERANVMTSKDIYGGNRLLMDLDDIDIYLAPSSTPGHWHLAFPQRIKDDDFEALVTLLNKVGIIKDGNYSTFKKHGFLALRTPWAPKGVTRTLHKAGVIGPPMDYADDGHALKELDRACTHLGVEMPNEIYQQLNAKLVSQGVDIPDSPPVD